MSEPANNSASRRAVLVTGASRGLGREIALAFARSGALVGVAYKGASDAKAAAEQTAADVEQAGGRAVVLAADLREPDAAKEIVTRFLDASEQRIDVLVNNAGIFRGRTVAKMSTDEWDDVIAVNLDAPARLIKAACRAMMRRRGGHIVNIASHAGVQGRVGGANYAAAKAGLIALSKSAARELGAAGVCVNAIMPGVLEGTNMTAAASDEFFDAARRQSTLGRLGDAAEVAAFIVHLSGMSRVSGQVFALDSRILPWG